MSGHRIALLEVIASETFLAFFTTNGSVTRIYT